MKRILPSLCLLCLFGFPAIAEDAPSAQKVAEIQKAAEAVKWFHKAVEQGDAEAQYKLAVCYGKGEGVAKDAAEAAKWYLKAAEKGHAQAQNALGACYQQGDGVPRDAEDAVKWYRKAADQGFVEAQCVLACATTIKAGRRRQLKLPSWDGGFLG